MLALNKLRKENETGFTLMELLVVILIIGILAAIAIPMFLNQRASAIDATTVSDTKTLANAIETEALKTPYGKLNAGSFAGTPLSAGTQWSMTSDDNGYCLQTFNPAGDQYKDLDSAATYDSSNGGVNKTGGACGIAGSAATAPAGSAIGALGSITFLDSDNPGNTITADGTYTYDGAAQTMTYSFDFKNLDAGKTYYVLINSVQSQGADPWSPKNFITKEYALSGGASHVQETVSLRGSYGPVISAPDTVNINKGFAMTSGYGSADINDPSPLTMK